MKHEVPGAISVSIGIAPKLLAGERVDPFVELGRDVFEVAGEFQSDSATEIRQGRLLAS